MQDIRVWCFSFWVGWSDGHYLFSGEFFTALTPFSLCRRASCKCCPSCICGFQGRARMQTCNLDWQQKVYNQAQKLFWTAKKRRRKKRPMGAITAGKPDEFTDWEKQPYRVHSSDVNRWQPGSRLARDATTLYLSTFSIHCRSHQTPHVMDQKTHIHRLLSPLKSYKDRKSVV